MNQSESVSEFYFPYLNNNLLPYCLMCHMHLFCLLLGKNIVLWKVSDIILQSVAMRQPVRLVFRYCSDVLSHACVRKCFTFIGYKLKVISTLLKFSCCNYATQILLILRWKMVVR